MGEESKPQEEFESPQRYIKDLTKPIATRKNDESRINASILVTDRDLLEDAQRYRDRLIEEGYDVKLVTYYLDDLIINPETKLPILHDSEELKEAIKHVRSSSEKTGLLTIYQHSNDLSVDIKPPHDEDTLTKLLLGHDLNEPNLNELLIKLLGCRAARKNEKNESRAKIIFDLLHEGGAGNFLGVATTEYNNIIKKSTVFNLERLIIDSYNELDKLYKSQKEIMKELAESSSEIEDLEELDLSDPDIEELTESSSEIEELAEPYVDLKDELIKINDKIAQRQLELKANLKVHGLKKSDSLVLEEFKLPSGKKEKFVNHPRLLSRDGQKFEFTRFFVAPIKAMGVSLVTVVDNIMDLMVQSERGNDIVQRAFILPEQERMLPKPPNRNNAQITK